MLIMVGKGENVSLVCMDGGLCGTCMIGSGCGRKNRGPM